MHSIIFTRPEITLYSPNSGGGQLLNIIICKKRHKNEEPFKNHQQYQTFQENLKRGNILKQFQSTFFRSEFVSLIIYKEIQEHGRRLICTVNAVMNCIILVTTVHFFWPFKSSIKKHSRGRDILRLLSVFDFLMLLYLKMQMHTFIKKTAFSTASVHKFFLVFK